jgi:hypothetical protein
MVAPEHLPWYDVATAFTNGASAVEPLAVMLPDTQLNEPGVPRVPDVVVVPELVVGVEPVVVLELPQAEITMVIASATPNRSAKRDFFVISPPT